jgi:hypothetical protein
MEGEVLREPGMDGTSAYKLYFWIALRRKKLTV